MSLMLPAAYARSLENIKLHDLPANFQLQSGTKTRNMKFDNEKYTILERQAIVMALNLYKKER